MAFDIAVFKSVLAQNGVLQSNKFDVMITTPPGLLTSKLTGGTTTPTSLTTINQDLMYRCISTTLPGMVLRTADINRFGLGILEKMPFSGSYTDVDFQFLVDRYGVGYQYWYAWLNYIFSTNGEEATTSVLNNRQFYTTQYKDNYATTMTITVYDNAGNARLQYKLLKAFPIFLADSRVAWEDNNNILKLSIRVTFREWALVSNNVPITLTGSTFNPFATVVQNTNDIPNQLLATQPPPGS
jgi:hypothetical protein